MMTISIVTERIFREELIFILYVACRGFSGHESGRESMGLEDF